MGDTLYREGEPVEPLPGFKAAKPMVRPTSRRSVVCAVCFVRAVCVVRYAASLTTFWRQRLQVFAGLYPADGESLDRLTDAFEKLTLNDASVTYTKERRLHARTHARKRSPCLITLD